MGRAQGGPHSCAWPEKVSRLQGCPWAALCCWRGEGWGLGKGRLVELSDSFGDHSVSPEKQNQQGGYIYTHEGMNYKELAPMTVAAGKGRAQRTTGAISSLSASAEAGEDQCPSSRTVRKRERVLPSSAFRSSRRLPQLIGPGPPTLGRVMCWPQSADPDANLAQNTLPGRHSCLTQYSGPRGPTEWTHRIDPHTYWTTALGRKVSSWLLSRCQATQAHCSQAPSLGLPARLLLPSGFPRLRAFLNRPLGPVGSFSRSPSCISKQSCPVLLFAVNKLDYEEQSPSS